MTLHHIGYVVRSLDGALARFREEGATVIIPPTEDALQRVRVSVIHIDGDVPVELVAPLDDAAPIRARLQRGGGLDHVCYAVDDLEAALERETRNGAVVVCPPCRAAAFAADVAFVQRRSGLVVELLAKRKP